MDSLNNSLSISPKKQDINQSFSHHSINNINGGLNRSLLNNSSLGLDNNNNGRNSSFPEIRGASHNERYGNKGKGGDGRSSTHSFLN